MGDNIFSTHPTLTFSSNLFLSLIFLIFCLVIELFAKTHLKALTLFVSSPRNEFFVHFFLKTLYVISEYLFL